MKRLLFFFTALFLIAFIQNGYAQSLSKQKLVYEKSNTSLTAYYTFKGDDGTTIFHTPVIKGKSSYDKDKNNAFLLKLSDDKNSFSSISGFRMDEDYKILHVFDNPEEVVVFYSLDQPFKKKYTLWKGSYSKSKPALTFAPTLIASFETSNYSAESTLAVASEDGSKHAIIFFSTDIQSNFKGMYSMVTDNYGNVLWEKAGMPKFPGNLFTVLNTHVSNDGIIYLPTSVTSRTRVKTGHVIDEDFLSMLIIREDEMEVISKENPRLTISSLATKLLDNGQILLAGYSIVRTIEKQTNSYFTLSFEPKDNSFGEFRTKVIQEFDETISRFALSLSGAGQLSDKDFSLVIRDIVQLANKDIILLGEQESKRYDDGYNYHTKNILYHNLSNEDIPNVQIEKSEKITKANKVNNLQLHLLSYSYFVVGNTIYFVYNDDIKNYDKPYLDGRIHDLNTKSRASQFCTIVAQIHSDGKVEKKMLDKIDNPYLKFLTLIEANDTEALLAFIGEKWTEFIKLSL